MSDGKTNLIVTGLSGMIGNRFQQLYGHKYSFESLDLTTGVDITDSAKVDSFIKSANSDIVLHLAAFTDVDQAQEQVNNKQGLAWQVNVIGTQNIAKAAKKHSKYLIHISTDFVFDGTRNKPYTEDVPTNPIEWYGVTKAKAEQIVQQTLERHAIIRTSFPFLAQHPQKLDVVRKIITGLNAGTLPPMFTDHIITPTFVDDLCKVFFMFTLKRPKGIWHATGSSHVSDYELAQIVKKTLDLKGSIQPGTLVEYLETNPRPYQRNLKISNAKLQQELGNPMLPVESALQIMKTQM